MKDIKDILQSLNLDLTNPEVVAGASDAINKILQGRQGGGGGGGGGGFPPPPPEIEQEIDPDLIQPPTNSNGGGDDLEMEIEDEEGVLNRVRRLGKERQQQNSGGGGGTGGQGQQSQDPQDPFGQQPQQNNQGNQQNQNGNNGQNGNQGANQNGQQNGQNGEQNGEQGEQGGQDGQNGQQGNQNGDQGGPGQGQQNNGQSGQQGGGGDDGGMTGNGSNGGDDGHDLFPDGNGNSQGGQQNGQGQNGNQEPGGDPTDDGTDEGENVDSDFTSKLSGENPKNQAQQIQIGRTINAANRAANKAAATGNKGVAGILESCIDMLEDMLEDLEGDPTEAIGEDELKQVIQRTLDAISEVDMQDLEFKSEEDRSQQVKKINDAMSDAGIAAELSAEDVEQIRADKQAVINNQREIDKYAYKGRSSFKGFEEFIQSLRKALAMQVESEKAKVGSWTAINRRHDGTDVVKPGNKWRQLPNTRIPVIDFYFDCSGSWTDDDLLKGDEALGKLAQLEKDGEIKINIFYFADRVHNSPDPARREGGTGAWNYIIDNIVLTKANNVVIMTDRDMYGQCANPPHRGYKVSGFVWYLWKDGVNAPNLPHLLQGRCGTMQYAFDS